MLERLKALNPSLPLFSVDSPEFAEYGRVLSGFDATAFVKAAEAIPMPEAGSAYQASVKEFEALPAAREICDGCFGTLDTQIGYCYGHSNYLNALEWHYSSEVNIAVTPLVLMLAKRSDIKNERIDSSCVKVFFVPAGTVIEVFATTLHFCPCEVSKGGFGCVVALPSGTNTPLDIPVKDPLLFRKNKWIFAHEGNTALLQRGVIAGVYGENYKINY